MRPCRPTARRARRGGPARTHGRRRGTGRAGRIGEPARPPRARAATPSSGASSRPEPWSAEDDAALSAAVGPGRDWYEEDLDPEFTLGFGWRAGRLPRRGALHAGRGLRDRPPTAAPRPDARPAPSATPSRTPSCSSRGTRRPSCGSASGPRPDRPSRSPVTTRAATHGSRRCSATAPTSRRSRSRRARSPRPNRRPGALGRGAPAALRRDHGGVRAAAHRARPTTSSTRGSGAGRAPPDSPRSRAHHRRRPPRRMRRSAGSQFERLEGTDSPAALRPWGQRPRGLVTRGAAHDRTRARGDRPARNARSHGTGARRQPTRRCATTRCAA